MQRRVVIIIGSVFALAVIVAGGFYWHWLNSPRYALQRMVLALQAKDMDGFFNYLDLKEIFNNLLQSSSKDLEPKAGEEADEWTRMAQQLGRKFARQLLPKLFEAFEAQIRSGIESYLLNLDNSQILGLTAAVTLAKIQVTGPDAQVTFHDPKTGDPLRFQMRRQTDTWRIVSINYQDLKKFCRREFHG